MRQILLVVLLVADIAATAAVAAWLWRWWNGGPLLPGVLTAGAGAGGPDGDVGLRRTAAPTLTVLPLKPFEPPAGLVVPVPRTESKNGRALGQLYG